MLEDWEAAYVELDTPEQAAKKNFNRLRRSGFLQHVRSGMRILDLCCGRGPTLRSLVTSGAELIGLDLSLSLLRLARHDGFSRLVCADSSVLPFRPDAFDAVVVQGGLHHFTTEQCGRAVQEIDRVLRPGGYFVFTEPANTWALRLYLTFVDTPLAQLSSYTRNWRQTLDHERETYSNWLATQRRAVAMIAARMELLRMDTGLVTMFGLARSRKPSGRIV